MDIDRRHPLRPFDPSVIQDFLCGRHVVAAEPLAGGRSNSTYRLALSDGGTYALRLYPQDTGRSAPEREAYVMGLVLHLVPVPEEVHRGEDWAVFTFLEGEPLQALIEKEFSSALTAAGEVLAAIGSLAFDRPGSLESGGAVTPFPFGGVRGFVEQSLTTPAVQAWLGPQTRDGLLHILERESSLLDELEADHCLVHGDFNPTNILINNGKVSGVLDWEFAHAGTPYMDIGNLLRHLPDARHVHVRAGLEAGGMTLPEDWRKRAALVDLTSHLEFLTTACSDAFKRECIARVEALLRPGE